MAFFQFGRKLELAKEYSFEEIPVFSSLSPNEQKIIEKKARLVEFKRGDIVYHEGAPADAFYVVISGRFRIFSKSRIHSGGQTLIFLYRGDHFGETSLLTGRAHSVSVEAKRNGLVLKLEKDDFLKLMQDIPAISLHLSRSLGHRLTRHEEDERHHEVKISALYSNSNRNEVFQFWLDLADSIKTETKRQVLIVDFIPALHPLFRDEFRRSTPFDFDLSKMDPSKESDINASVVQHLKGFFYIRVLASSTEAADEKKITTLLTFLTYRYHYLMLRLPPEINHIAFKALKQSDMVYVYCEPDLPELTACAQFVAELQQSFGYGKSEILVLVPESGGDDSLTFEEKENALAFRIFSQIPSKADRLNRYQAVLKYLAKELAGTLVGLALGSGAAYGLAHIGVIRVLEKEGISVDVVSGSSIGALIGAMWAAGYTADELEKMAKTIDKRSGFFKLIGFRDMSIAHRGFLKGNQVTRFLESYLGDKTFQDLHIPVKIIAANLFTSEEVVFENGRVVDAIRASISIPGIFRPILHQDQYLIDGGVVDPLPVRVLSAMGVKKIIGVNVLSGPNDRIERNRLQEEGRRRWLTDMAEKSFWNRMLARGLDKVYDRYAVNIFNVIMSTIQFMEYEIAEAWGKQADVLIHPIVQEAHWAEFYSQDKFIKAGEEKTWEQLGEIKRLLAE